MAYISSERMDGGTAGMSRIAVRFGLSKLVGWFLGDYVRWDGLGFGRLKKRLNLGFLRLP